jgi:hypothetical protein
VFEIVLEKVLGDHMSKNKQKDVINLVLKEAKAYTSIDLIESYIGTQKSMEHLPVQPLYVTVKGLPFETKVHALSLLSSEQRQVFYDLDLWQKDGLDINEFSSWVQVVSKSPDDQVRLEFANSNEFILFLKGRFNVWTFDVEDPMYPDHDYYFLTEDNLLLFEYDEACDIVDEVKQLIKDLYTEFGVEVAYRHLFTMVSDDFINFSEDEYRFKKNRLSDYGFVDYYDSLQVMNIFPTQGHLDVFIAKKDKGLGSVDVESQIQTLHQNSLVAFENNHDFISDELMKVSDDVRFNYLHFNFVRIINANMEFYGVMKDGPVAMTRVGKQVRNTIQLGLDYIKQHRSFGPEESCFDYFDFTEIFKIGHTLLLSVKKQLKKELASYELDDVDDSFTGAKIESFLDDVFSDEVIIRDEKDMPQAVSSFVQWRRFRDQATTIIELLPFIKKFKDVYLQLIASGQLTDSFYLNYDMASIDFEAIIISSFVNHSLDKFESQSGQKMGVTVSEVKDFAEKFMEANELVEDKVLAQLTVFTESFGLSEVHEVNSFIYEIIKSQMSGYDYNALEDFEFKHVGGPIIFNTMS